MELGRTLMAAVSREAESIALVDGDNRVTYQAMFELARRLVIGLDSFDLKPGDRILLITQNRFEAVLMYWAAQLAGIVIVAVNWRSTAKELEHFISDSGARAIVYESESETAVLQCDLAQALVKIKVTHNAVAGVSLKKWRAGRVAEDVPRATPEMDSVLLYTSGTTGAAKGVPRTQRAERAAAVAHVAQNRYRYGEVTLGVMPLYHTMGLRMLLSMAMINGTFVCQPRFESGKALSLIEQHHVSVLYLVPTFYHDMILNPAFNSARVSTVNTLGFAGASMTEGLLKQVDQHFKPDTFINHYGSTEIYTFTVNYNAVVKPGSAGKAGINSNIRVVQLGTHRELAAGTAGEICAWMGSDEAFSGYWNRPDADRRALHDGWYMTGDVGFVDSDGDLFVTGRVDDMMISGGENILPSEIESVLSLHPGVLEIAVAGVVDERLGHRVTAFVRRTKGTEVDDLERWCLASDLADFKRPREYVFVQTLPKSPVGKILRRQLLIGKFQAEVNPQSELTVPAA